MDFDRKKLSKEAEKILRICAVNTIRVGAITPSPVYTFMKLNEKFVAVKGPLDFFSSTDLQRYAQFGSLYYPEFVERVQPFISCARAVSSLLSWTPELSWSPGSAEATVLSPASYELADAVLRMIAPLWSARAEIEPFFVALFVDELCQPLPEALLVSARERSVEAFETAIFGSSWTVFLALHLGYCDPGFLARLREQVFRELAQGKLEKNFFNPVGDLLVVARESFTTSPLRPLKSSIFGTLKGRAAQKLDCRIRLIVEKQLIPAESVPATIYGAGGFVDV